LIPFSFAIFTVLGIGEVDRKFGKRGIDNMEVSKEEKPDASDRAQLRDSVSECAMFINAATLINLGLICN